MLHRRPACPDKRICLDASLCRNGAICRFRGIAAATECNLHFSRGDRIRAAGSAEGLRLQIVRSGMVAVCAIMADGRRQIMCFLVPGDVICPFELAGADCFAEALTDTETWEVILPAQPADKATDPDIAGILFELSHDLLARALGHVVQLGRFDGMERVCAFLLDIAERTGRRRNGTWHLTLPMSRDDIADYLGLNSETVSRILTRIKRDGIARFTSRTECEIQNATRLRSRVPLSGIGNQQNTLGAEQELRR